MEYRSARARLLNHANLGDTHGPEDDSLLHVLSRAVRNGEAPSLEAHVSDVLECLAIANLELNGPVPSESTARQNEAVIGDLAYALSSIVSDALGCCVAWSRTGSSSPDVLARLVQQLHLVAVGWDLVLAGDIDDLVGEARRHCNLVA